jgi:uncharacterized SAM-binding protein YcdF (DUF218 family)
MVIALPIVALIFAGSLWDFERRARITVSDSQLPGMAVVFTGQFDRVWLGLDLLAGGEVDRLFISGINRGAGIIEEKFQSQFGLYGDLLEAYRDGRIVLGTEANTTLENAAETQCWIQGQDWNGPILLVTSRWHMPRASVALEQALPEQKIWRLIVPERANIQKGWTFRRREEYLKYLATVLITQLPTGIRQSFGGEPDFECD